MTAKWMIRAGLLSALLAAQVGCTLGVNGGWTTDARDEEAQAKYDEFRQKNAEQRAANQDLAALREERVRFDGVNEAQAEEGETDEAVATAITDDASDTTLPSPAVPGPRSTRYLLGEIPTQDAQSASETAPNFRQVTFAYEGADYDPAIDPSGKWLVFASTQQRTTSDLYIKSVDGSTVRQLTDDPANDSTPFFSPDGKWIAYASDRSGNWDIYLISTDGGTPRQVTNSPHHEIHPSFSPDGQRLVYCTRPPQASSWQLAVIDLDNPSTPRFIGPGLFPDWSPKEDKIVFQRPRERGSRYFGVWTVELVDGEAKRPTLIAASANAAAVTPRWSPDGQRIVFCTIINPDSELQQAGAPVRSDIWMINGDGAGRVNLTRSQNANLQPVWASDGAIYFVSNRGKNGTESIWSVNTNAAIEVAQMKTQDQTAADTAVDPATETATVPTP